MNAKTASNPARPLPSDPVLAGLAPYAGFAANIPYLADAEQKLHRKIVATLEDAVRRVGLKDGMTISFHHAFREGDRTINLVVATLAAMGFRNLTLASSSLMSCNAPLIEHIRSGVIRRIYTSGMRGKLAEAISGALRTALPMSESRHATAQCKGTRP